MLTKLRLGPQCNLTDTEVPVSFISTVHTLETEISVLDLLVDRDQPGMAAIERRFLSRFTSLKHLKINICNTMASHDDLGGGWIGNAFTYADAPPSFDNFITSSIPTLASELEHLDIIYHKDEKDELFGEQLIWKIQSGSFTSFTKLKTLTVPLPFLTVRHPDTLTRLSDDLPTSLEQLTITHIEQCPTLLIQEISTSRAMFSNLVKIGLCSYPGEELPTWDCKFQDPRLVNNPASRMAGLMAGGLAASSQPARLYTKQGSSQPAEHQKPDGLIGLIV
jgi:hypothetical protein